MDDRTPRTMGSSKGMGADPKRPWWYPWPVAAVLGLRDAHRDRIALRNYETAAQRKAKRLASEAETPIGKWKPRS